MRRATFTVILLLLALSGATPARAQSISVFSHTTILANGQAMAECGTGMNDADTFANYEYVGARCGFFLYVNPLDIFDCPAGKPVSQCHRIYNTTPGQVYGTSALHTFGMYYLSPTCLQYAAAFYDPFDYGILLNNPVPRYVEFGTRVGSPAFATCWSGSPLALAYSDGYDTLTTDVFPSAVTLYESQTQTFGSSKTNVIWSLISGNGQLNGNVYTAPPGIAGTQTAIVQACDSQVPVDCAKATITLKNASLTVSPNGAEVLPATPKQYSAAILPSTISQTVTWSVTPVGEITPGGQYTAPANTALPGPVQVTVRACSTAISSLCNTATATVPKVDFTLTNPPVFVAGPGSTFTFGANVLGVVTTQEATVAPSAGTATPIGFNTFLYTPPAITAPQTVTFHVCLKLSPSTCTITGVSDPTMLLVPQVAISNAGTWAAGMPNTVTITGTGFGAAPEVRLSDASIAFTLGARSATSIVVNALVPVSSGGETLTVTVLSSTPGAGQLQASAPVPVAQATLGLTPPNATLREAQTQTFTASCTAGGSSCSVGNAVIWSATIGTLTPAGNTALYTAPSSVATTTNGEVKACWSALPQHCKISPVTITPLTVTVGPAGSNINGCSTKQFTATVTNASVTTVTWQINPQVGAIDSNGLYTAPCPVTTQSQVEVKACSTVNTQKCGTTTLTLVPITVGVNPPSANVQPGGSQQFSSVVQGTSNTGVNWSLTPAGAASGTIDANGFYVAPSTITVTPVTVTATSKADNVSKGTATVNLVIGNITVSPSSLTFAVQDVGSISAAQPVTVSNTGTAAVSVSSITTTGEFSQSNNCGASLSPGASCTINVQFTPQGIGVRSGTLRVTDSAPGSPHVVNLNGTGRAAAVTLSPPSLNFGGQRAGFETPTQTVTLSNTGTASLSISGITVAGEFTQTTNCGSSLAAGGSCQIFVKFVPAASSLGERLGTLSVSDSAPGSPHTTSLRGAVYGGFHDSATCEGSHGWAWDSSRPNTPINVYIYEGTQLLATVLADQYRPDLAGGNYGNAYHGFSWLMPPSLHNGQPHSIYITFSPNPSATPMAGSPKTTPACAPAPSYQGYHDVSTCQGLSGWAWDSTQPNTPVNVYFFQGSQYLGSTPANQFRQDLVNAGIGNGVHGFTWMIPTSLVDGQPHSLTVRYGSSTSDGALTGSPQTITCSYGPSPTASIVWIQPAESAWGPAGTLTAAGFAANGTGGVQLVWRERSSSGVWSGWNTVGWAPPPGGDSSWSNTISSGSPTNICHWFEAYVNYSGVTSDTFPYTGAPGCP